MKSPHRLGVRTLPFHGSNMGSSPIEDIPSSLENPCGKVAERFIAKIC
jgi:hypothetical protein